MPSFLRNTETQVEAQLTAMRSPIFEVLLLASGESRAGSLLTLSYAELSKRVPMLKAKNSGGVNIHVRPVGSHLILLDDLDQNATYRLSKEGFEPCVVVETSPANFQAWLDCGQPLADELATPAARIVAERFGADFNAASKRHAGRLAGFTNRKACRRSPSGLYPFVKLHKAQSTVFSMAPQLIQDAAALSLKPCLPAASYHACPFPARNLKTIDAFHRDPRYLGDLSRADFAYALYGCSHGVSEADMLAAILQRDMTKKGNAACCHRYALYTIRRARMKAGPPR